MNSELIHDYWIIYKLMQLEHNLNFFQIYLSSYIVIYFKDEHIQLHIYVIIAGWSFKVIIINI